MPEIEARLKAKCDRLVSAFEIDEAGECHINRSGINYFLW